MLTQPLTIMYPRKIYIYRVPGRIKTYDDDRVRGGGPVLLAGPPNLMWNGRRLADRSTIRSDDLR